MAKYVVEWGRVSPAQPYAAPMATAQAPAGSVADALRMASGLAHTLTQNRNADGNVIADIAGMATRGSSQALKVNARAVFWGQHDDWFVSITDVERYPLDGGYRAIAERKVRALWGETLRLRQEFPLATQARNLVMELRQCHAHHYPSCGGGCPADVYIANAETALKALENPS